jgi:hypothetical protein
MQFVTVIIKESMLFEGNASSIHNLNKYSSDASSGISFNYSNMTESPWSLNVIFSPCDVEAHPIFPSLRLDAYCSALNITATLEASSIFILFLEI